jgi:hypothetical protein
MHKQDAWEQRLLEAEVIAPPSGELFSETNDNSLWPQMLS